MTAGITITRHEQLEWARMAQDAYRAGHNHIGHRMSGAAALPEGSRLPSDVYDTIMRPYRRWLISGDFSAPV